MHITFLLFILAVQDTMVLTINFFYVDRQHTKSILL